MATSWPASRATDWYDSSRGSTQGGLYVAWRLGPERGTLGLYDGDAGRVVLGERAPRVDDARVAALDLAPAVEEAVRAEWVRCAATAQSPSYGVDARVEVDDSRSVAPQDAAARGSTQGYDLSYWEGSERCLLQPWRPLDSAAVYVAFDVPGGVSDSPWRLDTADAYGVLDGMSVWLGRVPSNRLTCYLVHEGDTNAFAPLRDEIDGLAAEGPSRSLRVVPPE